MYFCKERDILTISCELGYTPSGKYVSTKLKRENGSGAGRCAGIIYVWSANGKFGKQAVLYPPCTNCGYEYCRNNSQDFFRFPEVFERKGRLAKKSEKTLEICCQNKFIMI